MNVNQSFLIMRTLAASLNDWLTLIATAATSIRDHLLLVGDHFVGKIESQMLLGLLFGVQNAQNSRLHHKLRLIGMSSLWSASGLSITLFLSVQKFVYRTARYLDIYKSTFLQLLSLLFFWYMSSQSLSLLRAIAMSVLALIIRQLLGRQITTLYTLLISAAIILLLDYQHVNSWSLKFSLAAIFGIISLNPLFLQLFTDDSSSRKKTPRPTLLLSWLIFLKKIVKALSNNFFLFLSIQLGMMPLISMISSRLNLLSLVVNTFLAGLAPILFFVGLVWTCLLLMVMPFLSFSSLAMLFREILLLAALPLSITLELADQIVQLEQVELILPEFSWMATLAWYGLIFLLARWHQWRAGGGGGAGPSFNKILNLLNSPQENV